MKAVVVCPPDVGFPEAARARRSALLLPLIDRPFLQHVVERLVGLGVTSLEVLAAEHADAIEVLVGDGSRWGCPASMHLLRDAERPYERLRVSAAVASEGLLLVHADRLPALSGAAPAFATSDVPVLVRDGGGRWSGWAWLPPGAAAQLPAGLDEAGLEAHLAALPGADVRPVACVLEATSPSALLAANRAVQDGAFPGLLLTGREVEPGVWLSRNVVLHPRARITPPVYVGENVRVGAGTQLGPHAVVGRDCVLDDRSHLERAVVAPGGYVGEGLDLVDVIVERNLLINAEHAVATTVTDRFILGSLRPARRSGWGAALLMWSLALLLFLVGLPLLVLAVLARAFSRRPAIWHALDAVVQPAELDAATWRTRRLRALIPLEGRAAHASLSDLVLRVLPLLPEVLRGHLRLVGVPPRSAAALAALPPEWRHVVLRAPAGVLWEAHAIGARTDDERRAAETCWVVLPSLRHDLGLVGRYLASALAAGEDAAPPGSEGPP